MRACSRWLSFARTLSRGARRPLVAADTLAFIESLYGGKFTAVEGVARTLDRVYRMVGGGLFVSETHLSVSVHPRFELNLLNLAGGRTGSQMFREPPTTVFNLFSHVVAADREQLGAVLHGTNAAASSLTVQTWNVSPSGAERVPPAFSYISVRGQRVQPGLESARPTVRGEVMTNAEPSRAREASVPASLRLTSLDLRRPFVHTLRQEFVSVLLKSYLPTAASHELLSMTTTRDLLVAPSRRATAQGETERHFAPAPGMQGQQRSAWTYAEPSPRHAPGSTVEIRREFRSTETVREHATAPHASARASRPPLLHVLSPASLLLSLSETSLTVLAGGGAHTTYHLSSGAPALLLQHLHTRTAPSGTREGSVGVHAPQHQTRRPAETREVLSTLNTFVERLRATFDGITHTGHSTVFTRPGFEQLSARQRNASSVSAPGRATSSDLLNGAGEFVRPTSFTRVQREVSAHDASAQIQPNQMQGVFSTQGAPGAETFLFATALLRKATDGAKAGVLSPTAATALRLAAGETTRAARPEGMALELIRHHREEVLQLPQPGYVFTQPQRTQLEERQVITKASREEIVEVVRKEVRALAASAPVSPAPSRADLAGVADEVYSTLVRRLMVEKERLGRI